MGELNALRRENTTERINCMAYLVNAYWNYGNSEKAEELIKLCEAGITESRHPQDGALVDAYMLMAEYYLNAEYPYELSDRCIGRAAVILKESGTSDAARSGILYYLKGHSDYLKKDFENAAQYFNRSEEFLRNVASHVRYECFIYSYKVYLLFDVDKENGEAVSFAKKILERDDIPAESRAVLYYLTGWAYFNLKDTIHAEEYYKKAIHTASLRKTTINNSTLFRTYLHLSRLYSRNKAVRLKYLYLALEKARLISPTDRDVIAVYYDIANFYYRERNYSKTLQILQKALIDGSTSFKDTSILSNPSINSLRQYRSLIDILSLKAYALVRINKKDMAFTEAALQCTELGAELLKRRLNYVEVENSGLRLAENNRKIHNNAVTYATYLYHYKGGTEYAEKAFYYAERSKMQVLRINTAKPEILKKSGVPDSLIRKSERLANEILDLENRIAIFSPGKNNDVLHRMTDRLTYLYDERDFLNYDIIEKYPEYRKSRYDLRVPDISEIQSVLKSDQVLIEYQLTLKQLITFVISKDEFYLLNQSINKETTEHIETVRQLISENPSVNYNDSSFSDLMTSAHYLYDLLIKPVYDKIKGKRLIIIPHAKLTLIPFEVLIRDKYTGRPDYRNPEWLVKEFPVIYAFSANFLLDNPVKKYGKGTAVFVPEYHDASGENLNDLEGTIAEASFLKKFLRAKIFYGKMANERNFKKESPAFRILHIASHTNIDDRRPDLSCFIMHATGESSDDGRLHAYEIKQLKLNAKLAVLSGCNTGFGQLRLSEGFVSLARSFYYAGIHTIAYTLWSIADKSSAVIMKSFYRKIKHGNSLDFALMRAKSGFIGHADPVKAHPYYWAGFVVSGSAESISNYCLFKDFEICLIVVALGITGFIVYRRISG